MLPHNLGRTLCPALVLLAISSGCRNSVPPKIEICIGDGIGGADCIESNGSKLYRTPSMLKNYWATSQPDEANFSAWCYDTSADVTKRMMLRLEQEARAVQ